MPFFQTPPALGNQYSEDRLLRSYLARMLPGEMRRAIEPQLLRLGALCGGPLYELQLADRLSEPRLVQWDAWGHRTDRIELTPLWQQASQIAATEGLVATAYEQAHGALSRIHQFALCYLFEPSSDVYTCPLAMTDGAIKTLKSHGNQPLCDRALPRLLSRDPSRSWTSGQWMTERTGGSDVGISETVARRDEAGRFRLYGTKWFTSASTSQMALTLARPEGNGEGGKGLALFYVEVRDEAGQMNGIRINRLKDKLGTRKVPTAELLLDGTLAEPVAGLTSGVRNIAPMLNVTRTWNAVGASGGMRRAVALCKDYARRRVAFGTRLADLPLHRDTLIDLEAELCAAFHLTFFAIELLGREETGSLAAGEAELLRLVTPLAKLTTAKQAVAVASEALECFGGAGYVEDTGLPRLLRDAQVLPIWEGTTNVLSLDVLKVLSQGAALSAYEAELLRLCATAREPRLLRAAQGAKEAFFHGRRFLEEAAGHRGALEAGARRLSLTLGRALSLALLVRHGQWSLDEEHDGAFAVLAARFAKSPIDHIRDLQPGDDEELQILSTAD